MRFCVKILLKVSNGDHDAGSLACFDSSLMVDTKAGRSRWYTQSTAPDPSAKIFNIDGLVSMVTTAKWGIRPRRWATSLFPCEIQSWARSVRKDHFADSATASSSLPSSRGIPTDTSIFSSDSCGISRRSVSIKSASRLKCFSASLYTSSSRIRSGPSGSFAIASDNRSKTCAEPTYPLWKSEKTLRCAYCTKSDAGRDRPTFRSGRTSRSERTMAFSSSAPGYSGPS
ncbi:hypothetical protein SAXI111661_21120 [Saccharomonospora xinjiangensis]|nr:hypothetical protein EYD13_17830 [Saccharomonospora xinjiangensis]